jgi:hypothetical protein
MLTSFVDELSKIADSNFASPQSTGKGSNIVTQPAYSKSGISQTTNPAVKSTNYSIVHSGTPMAAENVASASTKAVPPPPVRT